ncbi:MAG: 4Fe-4S dicluster domain-containing protein [Bacteroidia bacterium]|nr:4Fe-4S dicluster domain-containing protein [Bacteroidia bacterium]
MEIQKKLLKNDSLDKLFAQLKSAGKIIIAPVRKGDQTYFCRVESASEIDFDYIQTVKSAKEIVFPRIEKLFDYKIEQDSQKISETDLEKFSEIVLFGIHPCDIIAFRALKTVFTWDYTDNYFIARQNKLTIIGLSCAKHDEYCFCTTMGIDPGETAGSDILFTKLSTGDFLAEIVTEKGKTIVDIGTELFLPDPVVNKLDYITKVPLLFEVKELSKKLENMFESPVWDEMSLRCLGCGACAYVCPVCSCFDIQDEGKIYSGCRYRCWDSCGFGQFTLHTSGHNPREEQFQRWRQRIMHKFLYQPDRQQVMGCVGCGRCSRACPVDMNILEHLLSLTI